MANISHKTLTGNQLHENKGVDTATADQVATATGAGATVWKKLTAANLAGTGNPFGAQLLHVREEVTNGANSSCSATLNTFNTQVLNTVKTNEIAGASLSGNTITLPAGTYFIEARNCPYIHAVTSSVISRCKSRLRNTSAGSTLLVGQSHSLTIGGSGLGGPCTLISEIQGRFTLGGSTNLELQTYLSNTSGTNVSTPNPVTSGEVEVYAEVYIWKIA